MRRAYARAQAPKNSSEFIEPHLLSPRNWRVARLVYLRACSILENHFGIAWHIFLKLSARIFNILG
jgi:hypothetical protein